MNRLYIKSLLFGCVCLILGLSVNHASAQCEKETFAFDRLTWLKTPKQLADEPFFTMRNKATTMEDFRGKVVVLNHWAIWCGPCIKEMPSLIRLSQKVDPEKIAIVPLSMDRVGVKKVHSFVLRNKWDGLDFYNDSKAKLARASKVSSIPLTQIIDPSGQEIARLTGAYEWDSDETVNLLNCLADTRP